MTLVENIIDIFNMQKENLKIKETFEYIDICYTSEQLSLPTNQEIILIQERISERDKIRISIDCDENEICKYIKSSNIDEFINKLNESLLDEDDINYKVLIHVEKQIIFGNLTIYDSEAFIENFKSLTLREILHNFNSLIKENGYILFRTEENINCNTKNIFFINETCNYDLNCNKRIENQNKRIANCTYLNSSEFNLIADDFILLNKSKNKELNKLFYKISVVYSLIGICDVSVINSDEITYVLNGYHRIENKFNFKNDFNNNLEEYIQIYNWIYNESSKSNCTDKIGIARNVISASLKEGKLNLPIEGIYSSVCSAHSIYLKENVKEYLEVKSKISEFNFELMQKMSELSKEIGKSLSKNAVAIGTFYGTVVVMNILSDKKLDNIFTRDITNLSIVICIISLLNLVVTLYIIRQDLKIFEQQYQRVKHNYDDILNSGDINNIFKNDEYFKSDKKIIKDKLTTYIIVWILGITILLMLIYHLGYPHVIELLNGFNIIFKTSIKEILNVTKL